MDTPSLVLPASGFIARTGDPILVWTASAGATSYDIEAALDAAFTVGVIRFTVNDSSVQRGFAFGKTYYWRVRAVGAAISSFSSSRTFVVPESTPAVDLAHDAEGRGYLLGQFKEGS